MTERSTPKTYAELADWNEAARRGEFAKSWRCSLGFHLPQLFHKHIKLSDDNKTDTTVVAICARCKRIDVIGIAFSAPKERTL